MKQKLFLTSVLIFGFLTQQLHAQNTPNTQQPTTTTQQTPVKIKTAPVKKWRAQVPVTGQVSAANAVDTVKNSDFSLNGQYQFLLSRSRSINGYKLVNPYRLTTVWKSVADTLAKERTELTKAKAKVVEQEKTINTLQAEVKGNENEVISANAKMDEISFLGLSFTKGTYNIIVWSIILILAISLFVVITRSAKNILEAKHRTQLYDEITTEYQNYKAKSSEKERKLARELQDERNIVEELKSSRKS